MKLIRVLFATVLLLGTLVPISGTAQDANLFWIGGEYSDGMNVEFGLGRDIGMDFLGGHLWGFGKGSISAESWLHGEAALLFSVKDKFYIGPLAGPNVDWINSPPSSGLAYLSGAGGVLAGYDVTIKSGLWACAKYKYTFEAENMFRDGWMVGAGGYVRF